MWKQRRQLWHYELISLDFTPIPHVTPHTPLSEDIRRYNLGLSFKTELDQQESFKQINKSHFIFLRLFLLSFLSHPFHLSLLSEFVSPAMGCSSFESSYSVRTTFFPHSA